MNYGYGGIDPRYALKRKVKRYEFDRNFGTGECANPDCKATFSKQTRDQVVCSRETCKAYRRKVYNQKRRASRISDRPIGECA